MERTSDVLTLAAADVMTRGPVTVSRATLAVEALNIMEQRKITSIVVVEDGSQQVAGRRARARSLADGNVLDRLQSSDDSGLKFMVQSSVEKRAARIRLVLFDVDGVLTDGRVVLHGDGSESKQFHIRDGIVMVWAQRVGLKIGLLSARMSADDDRACRAARHHARASGRAEQDRRVRRDRAATSA